MLVNHDARTHRRQAEQWRTRVPPTLCDVTVLRRSCAVVLSVALMAGCTSGDGMPAAEATRLVADATAAAVPTSAPLPTAGPAPTTAPSSASAAATPAAEAAGPAVERRDGVDVYRGLGAWVDVFDWAPAYAPATGPAVTTDDLGEMAATGVSTIYFQTSRIDDRGSGRIQNAPLVAEFLARAHELDMAVVGWFLPKWEDADLDLDRLMAIADFDVDGQRFDGVAVDIEGVPSIEQRSDWNLRLGALSTQLRERLGDDRALGAIVLPPTLIEVVNTEYWPNFPWAELAPLYDVWLPMSYWSFRDDDSPFADGYLYNADSTRRLRDNLGDASALVHAVGGIGAVAIEGAVGEPRANISELNDFVQSAIDTSTIGISIYDWASQDFFGRETMSELVQAAYLAG